MVADEFCCIYDYSANSFIRYGSQAIADELSSLYSDSRASGFGPEVWIHGLHFYSSFLNCYN